MALFSYDLTAMAQFVTDLDTRIATVETYLADARTTADTLAQDFTGQASDAFVEAHTTWQTTAAAYLVELRELRQQIDRCRQNYADAREANRQMFGWSGG
ncbi:MULTISPECIES: WXG100 family type VII secretion target [unclassified Nocardia]|uniref:WXG100 family type VII secretion target n=1 Tax=unclassified Nocardia TaxID=2637762 RepID=UPI0033A59722